MPTLKSIKMYVCLISAACLICGCAQQAVVETQPAAATELVESATPTEAATATEEIPGESYTPPSVEICPMIQEQASQALGVEFTLNETAPFVDPVAGESGLGCQIIATADGTQFESSQSVIATLIGTVGLGWTEQIDYQADGATGSASGLTRDMTIMLINANWAPAEAEACSVDQPISSCDLPSEQKIYTIEIDIAEYKADFSLDGHWVDDATGFTLDLYQDWKTIYGQHEVVAQGGNKIDALEASINGRLNGKTATVQFQSSFASEPGSAEITYVDVNTIHWKIITAPEGEYYLPAEAVLTR